MKLAHALLVSPLVCLAVFACSSDAESVPIEADAGQEDDGRDAASPADADIPPSDGARPDAGPRDAGPSKPLDVVCNEDPCYLAVSGNGSRHACGLLRDGTVRCWGRDTDDDDGSGPTDGALGRGKSVSRLEAATPAPVVGLANVTQLSVGPNLGTCARTSDGSVYCWGRNEFGQLGQPRSEARLALPRRIEGLPPVDQVALGYNIGCAVTSSDRALYCWGRRMNGLDVDAGGQPSFAPQLVPTFRPPVKSVVIGGWSDYGDWIDNDTIIAVLEGDVLATLGRAALGETSMTTQNAPLEVPGVTWAGAFNYVGADGLLRRWRPAPSIAFGYGPLYFPSHAGVVDAKSSGLYYGATGPGTTSSHQGGALLANGRLFRWGINLAGTLGVPPAEMLRADHPFEVMQVQGEVVSFATLLESTCASLVSGKIKCWGGNANGELGRGTVDVVPHPVAEVIR